MLTLEKFLWSKSEPRKSLYCHLYEAAIVMRILLTKSIYGSNLSNLSEWLALPENETLRLLMYLASLHDLGKCDPRFQYNQRVPFAVEFFKENQSLEFFLDDTSYRHEMGSYYAVLRIWEKKEIFADKKTQKLLAGALKLHHQGKKGDPLRQGKLENYRKWTGTAEWLKEQDKLEEKLRLWIEPPQISLKSNKHVDAACTVITSMIIMTDWIISSSVLSEFPEPIPEDELENHVLNFLDDIGLSSCNKIKGEHIYHTWKWLSPETMRPLQAELDTYLSGRAEMPLLMILEAPMEEGKTEAGIYAAMRMAQYWNKNGTYIGLPTSATSNQMQNRINALLNDHGINEARLLHSMAWLDETENQLMKDNDYDNWLKPTKRAMLSPWAVGTIDQALMSVLQVKYGILRLLGLTGKVLVLDEVHAYDAYMSAIMIRMLEWCKALKIPVVMLSATLPNDKRDEFLSVYSESTNRREGYPLISAVFEDGTLEQISVIGSHQQNTIYVDMQNLKDNDFTGIVKIARNQTLSGGCYCILVNTVAKAQAIYGELESEAYNGKLLLFHSRFTAARRKQIEEECIRLFDPDHSNRPEKAFLVATQVVEQSLDLDFDGMMTEIAPIDLILQRAGRLHRHSDTKRPEGLKEAKLIIIAPPDEDYAASGVVYYPCLLKRTSSILKELGSIQIPEDIPRLVNEVYKKDDFSDLDDKCFLEMQYQDDFKSSQADTVELAAPQDDNFGLMDTGLFHDDEDSWVVAKTRLGEDTAKIAIIPHKLYDEVSEFIRKDILIPSELAKRVMLYSITVRQKCVANQLAEYGLSGTGKLFGVKMFLADDENALPTETAISHTESTVMIADRNMGFIIKKEDESDV